MNLLTGTPIPTGKGKPVERNRRGRKAARYSGEARSLARKTPSLSTKTAHRRSERSQAPSVSRRPTPNLSTVDK